MDKNYIIKKGSSYFLDGSNIHSSFTFEKDQAARFTEFEACLKIVQMPDEAELEVIEFK